MANPWQEKENFEREQHIADLKSNIKAVEDHNAALEKQLKALEQPFRDAKKSADALFRSIDNSNKTFRDHLRHGSGNFQLRSDKA